MSFQGVELESAVNEITGICRKFRSSVESFYDNEALREGCIRAVDRDGQYRCMPLMSVSAAVMELPALIHRIYSPEENGKIMAQIKKEAKRSPERLCVTTLKHIEAAAPNVEEIQESNIFELADYRHKLRSVN
jgi:hypothetical protein